MYESDKIFDGPIRYDSKFMEIDFRRRIACSVNKKYSQSRKLEEVSEHDFDFVRCINKYVKSIDGDAPFDCQGINAMYSKGSIYMYS